VSVRTWVTRIGRSSFELQAAVCDGSGVYATSRAIAVGFDRQTGHARPLSAAERRALEARLVPTSH